MLNILQIIYDRSINNKIINIKDIEKILELLIVHKSLNDYILNINIQPIRSNNLASYSTYDKIITVYIKTIEIMIENIENNILINNKFEKTLYENLLILQIILHEVEHANQQKIVQCENNIEAFIIRLSNLVEDRYEGILYEYCPEERLAEIKSFDELIKITKILNKNLLVLSELLSTERLKRLLRAYHYKDFSINVPIIDYFTIGKKIKVLNAFEFNDNIYELFSLDERFKYGFPISNDEYGTSMKKLILFLNKNFNNRVKIK